MNRYLVTKSLMISFENPLLMVHPCHDSTWAWGSAIGVLIGDIRRRACVGRTSGSDILVREENDLGAGPAHVLVL
jgi:hypothetical protein